MAVIKRPADYQSCFTESTNVRNLKKILRIVEVLRLVVIISLGVIGFITAIALSVSFDSFLAFFLTVLGTGVLVGINYVIFILIIIDLKSKISVVYHSETGVKLQLFDMDESKQVVTTPQPRSTLNTSVSPLTKPAASSSRVEIKEDCWMCPCCGRKNNNRNIYCVDCGTKKP